MTTATQRMDLIRADAARYHPPAIGRLLATAITALFVAIGWTIGAAWYGTMFCLAAARYGFREGARIERAESQPGPAGRT